MKFRMVIYDNDKREAKDLGYIECGFAPPPGTIIALELQKGVEVNESDMYVVIENQWLIPKAEEGVPRAKYSISVMPFSEYENLKDLERKIRDLRKV